MVKPTRKKVTNAALMLQGERADATRSVAMIVNANKTGLVLCESSQRFSVVIVACRA